MAIWIALGGTFAAILVMIANRSVRGGGAEPDHFMLSTPMTLTGDLATRENQELRR